MSTEFQWVDTHAHLDYEYPFTQEEYLKRARDVGVRTIVTIGANEENWDKIKDFAEKEQSGSQVYFTAGIHPHESKVFTSEHEKAIERLAQSKRFVAVGELGLDYHYENSAPDLQKEACHRQLDLAKKLKKPVIIHSRDAEEDLLPLLEAYARSVPSELSGRPGVIHCFSGSQGFAEACLKLGFYISFSGIVTFKSAAEVRKVVESVPLNRILTETDAPYLAPIPYRGKQNESAYMIETCKVLAQIKAIDLPALAKATCENARELFQFQS